MSQFFLPPFLKKKDSFHPPHFFFCLSLCPTADQETKPTRNNVVSTVINPVVQSHIGLLGSLNVNILLCMRFIFLFNLNIHETSYRSRVEY